MADQKNHSFTSSSEIRRLFFYFLLFSFPVIAVLMFMEYTLTKMDFSEPLKQKYIDENSDSIKILFLGSSQVQRAVNPHYLSQTAINLANKSQILYDDLQLLKHFEPQLPQLALVVFEVSYDKLERDESHTSHLLDPVNLKFYDVNTFNRPLKIQDHSLFFADPEYFSVMIKKHFSEPSSKKFNKYGFDENRYRGIFKEYDYEQCLIPKDEIIIENVRNEQNFKNNLVLLHQMIDYCFQRNLKVMIYHPPTHPIYNSERDPELLKNWRQLLKQIKLKYPEVRFFIDDKNSNFNIRDFYNGNHLNPKGAKKATKILDSVISKNFPEITSFSSFKKE